MSGEQSAIMQVNRGIAETNRILIGADPEFASNRWDSGSVHTPATDRSEVVTRDQIGVDGVMTGIKVRLLSGAPDRSVYINVTLEDNDQNVQQKLMQGYLNAGSDPFGNGAIPVKKDWFVAIRSWSSEGTAPTFTLRGTIRTGKIEPGGWTGTDEDSLGGKGNMIYRVGTDPAADTETSDTIPTGAIVILRAYYVRYVTDSTAANRHSSLTSTSGGNFLWLTPAGVVQTASLTVEYGWASGYDRMATILVNMLNSPLANDYPMDAGTVIATSTTLRDPQDNYGAPMLSSEEWLKTLAA